jgi:7-carboxy-7-deazaguanine synthase
MSEIYAAEQGEGRYSGTPSVIVRTTGCNLRCWFCDTPYTSWKAEGEYQKVEDIVSEVLSHEIEHVVVTGGEPLMQPAVVPLTEQLKAAGRVLTIETAGTLFRPVTADLISLSPKMSNSVPQDELWKLRHEQLRHAPTVIAQFREQFHCQFKFVIDKPEDLAEVDEYVSALGIPVEEIWLMPQARTPEELHEKNVWLAGEAERRGWQLSPRLHIERFGNVRGK